MGPSGEIKDWSEVLKMPDAKQKEFIPIPDEKVGDVMQMNRKQRRGWYRKNKKLLSKREGGVK